MNSIPRGRPRPSAWVLAGALAFALVGPRASVAHAKPKPKTKSSSKSKAKKAKSHFERAEAHYELGRFGEALEAYVAAYEIYPHPGFLFNIAQCHRNVGNLDEAIFFFENYLKKSDAPKDRARVEALLVELTRRRDAARAEAEAARQVGPTRSGASTDGTAMNGAATDAGRSASSSADPGAADPASTSAHPAPPESPPAGSPPFLPSAERSTDPSTDSDWLWPVIGGVVLAVGAAVIIAVANSDPTIPQASIGVIDAR